MTDMAMGHYGTYGMIHAHFDVKVLSHPRVCKEGHSSRRFNSLDLPFPFCAEVQLKS